MKPAFAFAAIVLSGCRGGGGGDAPVALSSPAPAPQATTDPEDIGVWRIEHKRLEGGAVEWTGR